MKQGLSRYGVEVTEFTEVSELSQEFLTLQEDIYAKDELYSELDRPLTDTEKSFFSTFYGGTVEGFGSTSESIV